MWLHFRGKHGAAPPWWWVLEDATAFGVPPWVLNREPIPCTRYWSRRQRAASWAQYDADHWETEVHTDAG